MQLIYPNYHSIIFLDTSTHDIMILHCCGNKITQITRFMGPSWGSPGSCRPQVDPMLPAWTSLSGYVYVISLLLAEKGGDQSELILLMAFDKLKNRPINKDCGKWNILLSSDRCLQPLLVAINNFCWSHIYTMNYMVLLNYLYGIAQLFI